MTDLNPGRAQADTKGIFPAVKQAYTPAHQPQRRLI